MEVLTHYKHPTGKIVCNEALWFYLPFSFIKYPSILTQARVCTRLAMFTRTTLQPPAPPNKFCLVMKHRVDIIFQWIQPLTHSGAVRIWRHTLFPLLKRLYCISICDKTHCFSISGSTLQFLFLFQVLIKHSNTFKDKTWSWNPGWRVWAFGITTLLERRPLLSAAPWWPRPPRGLHHLGSFLFTFADAN